MDRPHSPTLLVVPFEIGISRCNASVVFGQIDLTNMIHRTLILYQLNQLIHLLLCKHSASVESTFFLIGVTESNCEGLDY